MAKFNVNKIITESLLEVKTSGEEEVLDEQNTSDIAKDLTTPAGMAKKAQEKIDADAAKTAQEKADNIPEGKDANPGALSKKFPQPDKEQKEGMEEKEKAINSDESYQTKAEDSTVDKIINKGKEYVDAGVEKGKQAYKAIEDMPTSHKIAAGSAIAAGLGALTLAKKLRGVKKAKA